MSDDDLQCQLNECAADVVLLKKKVASLQSSLKEKDGALQKATAKNEGLQKELEKTKVELLQIKADKADKARDIRNGGDSKSSSNSNSAELKQRYEELANITAAMLKKDTDLRKIMGDHKVELARIKGEHKEVVAKKEDEMAALVVRHKADLEKKNALIKQQEKELGKEDATIFRLNRINEELKLELELRTKDAEEEQERTNKEIKKLKKKAKKYDKLQDDTKTVYTNYKDELTALREVNEILRLDVARWEAECAKAQTSAKEAIDRANLELQSFEDALHRVEELRSDTELELVETRLTLGDLEAQIRECTCKFEREAKRQPEPLNSWVIICPSLVTVIPREDKPHPPIVDEAKAEAKRAKVELTELEEQVAHIEAEFKALL